MFGNARVYRGSSSVAQVIKGFRIILHAVIHAVLCAAMAVSCCRRQVAEHKRAVDKMLEDKRAMYEAARAAEEQQEAARCVCFGAGLYICAMPGVGSPSFPCVATHCAVLCQLILPLTLQPPHSTLTLAGVLRRHVVRASSLGSAASCCSRQPSSQSSCPLVCSRTARSWSMSSSTRHSCGSGRRNRASAGTAACVTRRGVVWVCRGSCCSLHVVCLFGRVSCWLCVRGVCLQGGCAVLTWASATIQMHFVTCTMWLCTAIYG